MSFVVQICSNAVGWHLKGALAQPHVQIVGMQPGSSLYTREDLQLPDRKETNVLMVEKSSITPQ